MSTHSWTGQPGNTSGNWSADANWAPTGSPITGDDVFLNRTLGGPYIVTYDEPTLSLGTLQLSNANATLQWDITAARTLTVTTTTLNGGTIDLATTNKAGSSLVTDTLTVSSGTFLSDNTVTVTGLAAFSGGPATTASFTGGVFNAGTVTLDGVDTFITLQNATLTAGAGGIVLGTSTEIHMDPFSDLLDVTAGGLHLGDFATVDGQGTITGEIDGFGTLGGTIQAFAGALVLTSDIGLVPDVRFSIHNNRLAALQVDGSVAAGNTFAFEGAVGDLIDNHGGADTFDENIIGLNVSTVDVPSSSDTNFIDFNGETLTVTNGTIYTGATSAHIVLSDNSTLDVTGITGPTSGTWYVRTSVDSGGTTLWLDTVCFAAGTRILTPAGERAVESLGQGDAVLTVSGGQLVPRPVKWLGRRRIDLAAHPRPANVAPIRIRRGALAENVPHRDLLVSPDHAICIDGRLICARQLVNGTTIRQRTGLDSVEYCHVELDGHAILLAEGAPAESYLDTGNRGFFANSDAPPVLRPDLTDTGRRPARVAGSCMPFACDEADVKPIWQRLAERAATIGLPVPMLETTTDPDLCIIARGRVIRPLPAQEGRFLFVLPPGTSEVRLVSRAGAPTDARPWLEDRRCLGVYVERVLRRAGNEVQEIALDHPALSRGWWSAEHTASGLRRWTDGDADLPLSACGGPDGPDVREPATLEPAMLEIWAGSSGLAYVCASGVRTAA